MQPRYLIVQVKRGSGGKRRFFVFPRRLYAAFDARKRLPKTWITNIMLVCARVVDPSTRKRPLACVGRRPGASPFFVLLHSLANPGIIGAEEPSAGGK